MNFGFIEDILISLMSVQETAEQLETVEGRVAELEDTLAQAATVSRKYERDLRALWRAREHRDRLKWHLNLKSQLPVMA